MAYRYEIIKEERPPGKDPSQKTSIERSLSRWAREGWKVAHYSVTADVTSYTADSINSYLVHNFILER